jgi:hypothetical protein
LARADITLEWESRNQRVIDERRITGRTREVPGVRVPMTLVPGEPVELRQLPRITIAPGVAATLGWGRGALLERVEMQPAAVFPPQTLHEELIVIVQDGSASVDIGGTTIELSKDDVSTSSPAPRGR